MTVAALPSVVSYVEDGATVAFPVPYRFRADGLTVDRIVDGVSIPLAVGIDYSSTGGETDAGGTLTRTAATSGGVLRIRRSTSLEQSMTYATGDRFPAASHEDALDQRAMVSQDLARDVRDIDDRALMAAPGETIAPLGPLDQYRGKAIGLDASKRPVPIEIGDANDPGLRTDLATGNGALVGFDGRDVGAKLLEMPTVTDARFAGGAKPDCVYAIDSDIILSGTDSTAAFIAAYLAGVPFSVPPGWYRITNVALVDVIRPVMFLEEGAWIVTQPPRYNGTQNPFISAFLFMRCPGAKVIGASKYGCGIYVQGASEANGVSMVHCGGGEVITQLSIIKGVTPDIAIKDDTFQTGWTILNAPGGNPRLLRSDATVTDVFSDGFAQYGGQFYGDLSDGRCLRNTFGKRTGRPDQPLSHGCAMAITRGVGPLLVDDCDMRGMKEFGVLGSSAGRTSRDITINNNKMDGCGRGGVSWTEEADLASEAGQGTINLTIKFNSFTGTGKGDYATGVAGVRVGSYDGVGFIDGLSITDNIFDDNTAYDILIQSNAAAGKQVTNGKVQNNRRRGGDGIVYSLAIGAGVGGVRHQDVYFGAAAKDVFDVQSYHAPLTLQGDFTNIVGEEYVGPSYTTRPENGVKLWGRVDGTAGLTIATLPAGARPQYNIAFGGGGMGRGSVRMNGAITADVGPGPWDLSAIPSFFPYAK